MARREALIGLDLGTTSIKAVALDPVGAVVDLESAPTPTTHLPGGYIEHDADALWAAVCRVLTRLTSRGAASGWQVIGIATTSMGEAGVPVAADGSTLHPVIAWLDQRAAAQMRRLQQRVGRQRLQAIVGHPVDNHWGVPRLMWLREERPRIFERTRSWLSVADLVVLRLTGVVATDLSLASRTMAFDQDAGRWSDEVLDAAAVPGRMLPDVSPSGSIAGTVIAGAARLTGLPAGVPVALGGHDRACGAFAARGGTDCAIDSAGTAEALMVSLAAEATRELDVSHGIARYFDVIPGRQLLAARVGLAGGLVEWARKQFFGAPDVPAASYEAVFGGLAPEAGFSGVVCYPTFGRSISPDWIPGEVRGAFVGLTMAHTRTDLLRAILEATCFSLRANISAIEHLIGAPLGRIRVEGGVVRNPVWLQMKADVANRSLESVTMPDLSAVGAALLAGIGAGCYADATGAAATLDLTTEKWRPRESRAVMYERAYETVYRPVAEMMLRLSKAYGADEDGYDTEEG
jgi:xylulokinase